MTPRRPGGQTGSFGASAVSIENESDSDGNVCAEGDPFAPFEVTLADHANGPVSGPIGTDTVVIGDGCSAQTCISGGLVTVGAAAASFAVTVAKSSWGPTAPAADVFLPDGEHQVGRVEDETDNT